MAKSVRASVSKRNSAKLRATVFGPVDAARTGRLSAKLQELASQPKPNDSEKSNGKAHDVKTGTFIAHGRRCLLCFLCSRIYCTDEQDRSTGAEKPESSEGWLVLSSLLHPLNIHFHTESADPGKAWTSIREPVRLPRVARINQGAFKNALENIPLFSTRTHRKGRGVQRS